MIQIATLADKSAVEAEMPVGERWSARSLYQQLQETAARFPGHAAVSFQLRAGPTDKAVTETWAEFLDEVTRAANLFRRLGINQTDCGRLRAAELPRGAGGADGGGDGGDRDPDQPAADRRADRHDPARERREGGGHARALPEDRRAAEGGRRGGAGADGRHGGAGRPAALSRRSPLAWIIPFIRPKITVRHKAKVLDFRQETRKVPGDRLEFAETLDDRFCARFHTGGTTGLPKFAQHRASGILYNGWCGSYCMFTERDVLICPLPMFHVFAAYAVFMSCLVSGAQLVMVTPQGYRGEGVYPNFWKLVARWKVSFLITVPTAAARLMQMPVDADISTLRLAVSGSAAMPLELFQRFEAATGVQILEGYGMTETTCLISLNPPLASARSAASAFRSPTRTSAS
jgi:fatty-acyl-CoA synthase